jgi:putative ABC transport system permease protein
MLVRTSPGADPAAIASRIEASVSSIDVNTTAGFSWKTRRYWLFTTGAGIALLVAAVLGVIVGTVIVGQTIYATTVDHIRDFGVLKAIGASDSWVYRVIVEQAIVSAALGYVLGIAASFGILRLSRTAGAMILAPWELITSMFFLAVAMCVTASLISIHKVTRLDPAVVFRA